jgi:hypothetical protein
MTWDGGHLHTPDMCGTTDIVRDHTWPGTIMMSKIVFCSRKAAWLVKRMTLRGEKYVALCDEHTPRHAEKIPYDAGVLVAQDVFDS